MLNMKAKETSDKKEAVEKKILALSHELEIFAAANEDYGDHLAKEQESATIGGFVRKSMYQYAAKVRQFGISIATQWKELTGFEIEQTKS